MKKMALFFLFLYGVLFAKQEEPYLILSIDGGGIRGIIPATFLALLEEETKAKSGNLFDFFAGSSTGGILAMGLVVPKEKGSKEPKYGARDLQGFYVKDADIIFSHSWKYQMESLHGLLLSKYQIDGLQKLLENEVGHLQLKDVVKDVCITSFDVTHHHQYLFENTPKNHDLNCPLMDIVLSTSAAPSYFPSHVYQKNHLVDGGILANNPAAWAYFEALKRPACKKRPVIVLSLGTGYYPENPQTQVNTGLIQSIEPLIDELFDASNDTVTETFKGLSKIADVTYIRVQPQLENADQKAMDNTSQENIAALVQIAKKSYQRAKEHPHFLRLLSLLQRRHS